jgi:hypothetical protein
LSNIVAIAAADNFALALRSNSSVVAWGTEVAPPGLSNVVAVAGGGFHALALKSDGTVLAWGGPNTYGETTVPAGLTNVVDIAAGRSFSLALKSDGTVIGWGENMYGQTNIPFGLSNVVAIAGGGGYGDEGRSFAIRIDLRIEAIGLTGLNTDLRFRAFSGQQYSVEYSPDLELNSWVALPGGVVQGNWPQALVTDTNALAGAANRFYRIRLLPSNSREL